MTDVCLLGAGCTREREYVFIFLCNVLKKKDFFISIVPHTSSLITRMDPLVAENLRLKETIRKLRALLPDAHQHYLTDTEDEEEIGVPIETLCTATTTHSSQTDVSETDALIGTHLSALFVRPNHSPPTTGRSNPPTVVASTTNTHYAFRPRFGPYSAVHGQKPPLNTDHDDTPGTPDDVYRVVRAALGHV